MEGIASQASSALQGVESKALESLSAIPQTAMQGVETLSSMPQFTSAPASTSAEDHKLLESLGLATTTSPLQIMNPTSTSFPPLVPGATLDTDVINQKLTKLQSSIDDGFAQVIAKMGALSLAKQGGGTRRKRKAKKSRRILRKK